MHQSQKVQLYLLFYVLINGYICNVPKQDYYFKTEIF